MITWAVLPVKRYFIGKSRLRQLFSDAELAELNRKLFESTFTKIQELPEIDKVLVVSRELHALEWCEMHNGAALPEDETSSLNLAISKAQEHTLQAGVDRIVVLPSDLPLMTIKDLNHLICLAEGANNKLVIVPDHYQSGTNALVISGPDLIQPKFGFGSFRKHIKQAMEKDAELIVYLNENIQWDLDTSLELYRIINTQPELDLLSHIRKEISL